MYIFKVMISFALLFSQLHASSTFQAESTYIDETHKTVSGKVLEWSDDFDTMLSGWLENEDSNVTTEDERKQSVQFSNKRVKSVDSFFQNRKYFDKTEETFMTLRLDSEFQSRESNDFRVKFGGQIALSKSKKSVKFFIDNATPNNIVETIEDYKDDSLELGFHYFSPEKYGIESRYSLGLRGIDPFIRARYYMKLKRGLWYIEPSQTFKYSVEDKFEEETNIYFDRHFDNLSLFRISLHRKTQDDIAGMDYDLTLQYYWTPFENIGLRFSQSFFGNTKYPYAIDSNIESPQIETYSGIYNYASTFSLRHNIWRKWFFYEVRPGVSFHKEHDYEPNYTFRLFLDFHFGKF